MLNSPEFITLISVDSISCLHARAVFPYYPTSVLNNSSSDISRLGEHVYYMATLLPSVIKPL